MPLCPDYTVHIYNTSLRRGLLNPVPMTFFHKSPTIRPIIPSVYQRIKLRLINIGGRAASAFLVRRLVTIYGIPCVFPFAFW